MMLINDNEVILNDISNIGKSIIANTNGYLVNTRFDRNATKAKLVTQEVQEYIDKVDFLFTGKSEIKLDFAEFKKTKGGQAEAFNNESKPLVSDIISTKNSESIKKAKDFWTKQLDADFGKKVKEKQKLKAIYTNLASVSVLENDNVKAKEYYDLAKKNAGLLDAFGGGTKKYLEKIELSSNENTSHTINAVGKYAYYITVEGKGVFFTGKKDLPIDKIRIERFVPKIKSNMVSLNSNIRPKMKLYENGKATHQYPCYDKHKVTFENGTVVIFKLIKGTFFPYIQKDGSEEKLY